jgi:hypothetical protein
MLVQLQRRGREKATHGFRGTVDILSRQGFRPSLSNLGSAMT